VIRVVLAGAGGRMGRALRPALERAGDIEIAARLERGDDLDALVARGLDVLVDFTRAEATRTFAPTLAAAGVAPVIGTSGLGAADREMLARACARGAVGGLLVPNFSIGAILQMRFASEAARWLACLGIHEVHHPHKLDAPSGTARATADLVARHQARPVITSDRRPGVLARQRVDFASDEEWLRLEHDVCDRRAFVPGVLLAIRHVRELGGLVVGLDALLGHLDAARDG